MITWSSISISRKLPSVIAVLCVCASVSIAVVGYLDFRRNIIDQARNNIVVLTESRGDALVAWFENLGSGVSALGRDPTVVAAVDGLNNSFNLMIDRSGLQNAYISNNPHPAGQRYLLNQAPESVPYHFQHGRFHPFFRQTTETVGYYDVFLFNLSGDLIYSVAKEQDFATNFVTGSFATTGLAEVFAAARDGVTDQVYFADYAAYPTSTGVAASFLATPVHNSSGQIIGVLAVQIPTQQINAIVNSPLGLGETGEVYAVGGDLTTRSKSRFADGHTALKDVSGFPQALSSLEESPVFFPQAAGLRGADVVAKAARVEIFDQVWGLVGEISRDEVIAPAIAVRDKMIGVTLLVAGISVVLGWVIARSFVAPLARLGAAMERVSQKDYESVVEDRERGDEIGGLSKALVAFRDKLQASDAAEDQRQLLQAQQAEVVASLSTALTRLSSGDLTYQIKTGFPMEYEELRQNYNSTVDTLNETIGSVVSRSSAIRRRSDVLSQSSDDLSRRTENQAATLEQTAAALDQLTASVKSAADGAKEVAEVVGNARMEAQESEPVVQNAVRAMTEIEGSSEEISQIISVIDDIAFQTNLLALNAGVEAARAGEAGRGFAVVASEVRALAQRSSDAAKQIKTLISQSSAQVERGVDLVGEAGKVLTKIAGHINHISGLVGEISADAQEQSTGLGEINIGVTQLDKVTQQNAAMVEQATAASHALNGDAGHLAELVTRFELKAIREVSGPVADNITTFIPQRAEPDVPKSEPSSVSPSRKIAVGENGPAPYSDDDIWKDF